jgi:hypothetical protein
MLANLISRIRRNHGLEHATIHVLSSKHQGFSAQGNAAPDGFYLNIYGGDVNEEDVAEAVEDAYRRMKQGEVELAIHPNCGTNLLTTATFAALAAQFAFGMEQRRQQRSTVDLSVLANALPSAVLAVALAMIVSRPFGHALQANVTTDGQLEDLRITAIRPVQPSVITRLFQVLLGRSGSQVSAYKVTTVD